MKRKTAARIAGLTAWERNRPAMIAASQKGGRTCAEKHGRSFYVRLAARRWDKEANGGRRNGEEEAGGRDASCLYFIPLPASFILPDRQEATA